MYEVEFIEEARVDYNDLDGSQQLLIDKSLKRIQERGMQAGAALRGSLAGCRKMVHKKAGLRVIFRESRNRIELIYIIAVDIIY
ncbi:addiction module toxin RelE [Carnobacteriaceae bacterium 52-44]|jgi:mRNA interferase RelE/StbE